MCWTSNPHMCEANERKKIAFFYLWIFFFFHFLARSDLYLSFFNSLYYRIDWKLKGHDWLERSSWRWVLELREEKKRPQGWQEAVRDEPPKLKHIKCRTRENGYKPCAYARHMLIFLLRELWCLKISFHFKRTYIISFSFCFSECKMTSPTSNMKFE